MKNTFRNRAEINAATQPAGFAAGRMHEVVSPGHLNSKLVIILLFGTLMMSGCGALKGFLQRGGFRTTWLNGTDVQDAVDDPEERPGYRRTLVGAFADTGFGIVSLPFFYVCGYGAICVTNDEEVGQAAVYPFGMIGAAAFAAPVVILKFVFYDVPDGIGWLLTTQKGKVEYYIRSIEDLSQSEYDHLVELTGRDFGDVSRHKNFMYSWGIADPKACARWRAWWKKNRNVPLDELRRTAGSRGSRGPEDPAPLEGDLDDDIMKE